MAHFFKWLPRVFKKPILMPWFVLSLQIMVMFKENVVHWANLSTTDFRIVQTKNPRNPRDLAPLMFFSRASRRRLLKMIYLKEKSQNHGEVVV